MSPVPQCTFPSPEAGDPFAALFAIRLGSCKTTLLGEKGYGQVAGYHMIDDIIGLDGRLLSRFQASELLQVQGRVIKLLDLTALKQLAGHR